MNMWHQQGFLNVQYSSNNKWHKHYLNVHQQSFLNVQDSSINKWHQHYLNVASTISMWHQQCLKVASTMSPQNSICMWHQQWSNGNQPSSNVAINNISSRSYLNIYNNKQELIHLIPPSCL